MRVGGGFGPRMTAGSASLPDGEVGADVARRTFVVIDIVEILVHWYAGRSQHELSASLGAPGTGRRVGPHHLPGRRLPGGSRVRSTASLPASTRDLVPLPIAATYSVAPPGERPAGASRD